MIDIIAMCLIIAACVGLVIIFIFLILEKTND